jgi:ABC-type transporter Mla subunit MlaD
MPYEKMKLYVGIFITFILLFLLFIGYFILDNKGAFNKRYIYYTKVNSANGINIGMPIKFSGFNIGKIDTIELNEDGTVTLTFSVDERYKKLILSQSVLVLQKPLIGSSIIEFYRSANTEELNEGSFIEMVISDDINDTIARFTPVVEKLINIVTNIENITQKIASDDSDLSKTLKNLEKFSSKMANDDSLLTTITGDTKTAQTLVQALEHLNQTLANVNTLSGNLDTTIVQPSSQSIEYINTILQDIQQKLQKLDSTINSVGVIQEQIEYTTVKSNEILDKVDTVISNQDEKVTLP